MVCRRTTWILVSGPAVVNQRLIDCRRWRILAKILGSCFGLVACDDGLVPDALLRRREYLDRSSVDRLSHDGWHGGNDIGYGNHSWKYSAVACDDSSHAYDKEQRLVLDVRANADFLEHFSLGFSERNL